MTVDEEQLIEQAKTDPEAFGKLYELYVEKIYNYVYYRIGNQQEAEDLTEAVFLKVWEKLRSSESPPEINNFRAWLYRVAHNQIIDFHRKKRPVAVDFHENPGMIGRSDKNTEADVQKNLDEETLIAAIEQLDEQAQEIIVMRFINGLNHSEVGEALEIEPGHVRVIQHRALKKLKEIMSERDDE